MPTINIKQEQEIRWDKKVPCILEYIDDDKIQELPARIKYRGGSSSKFYKHSFALELDDKYPLGNLPNDDDWVLNANYIDKTFMRHKISFDIFREMSAKNKAPQSAYVTINLNGNYEGLYVLMEKMNAGMIGLDKADTMAMLFKEPPIFYSKKLEFVQDSTNYYQQKYPKISHRDKTPYIESFSAFLKESDDHTFAQKIDQWVDIENIIDWHIILLFSNNGDGVLKNFYLYKIDSKTPFRIGLWDYDHSFGRDGDNELNMSERGISWERCPLLFRLANNPNMNYSERLEERWFELRKKGIISEKNFKRHVDKNSQRISNYIQQNFTKWPVNNDWYYDDTDYHQELDTMQKFVEIRLNQMDAYEKTL